MVAKGDMEDDVMAGKVRPKASTFGHGGSSALTYLLHLSFQ